jgi:subtilisin family serine protease
MGGIVRQFRATQFLVVLATLLGLGSLFHYVPGAAHNVPLLPQEITASLTLGTSTTRTLTLQNPGTTPITVTLYEAEVEAFPESITDLNSISADTTISFPPDSDTSFFLVYLRDQADLTPAYRIADWNERGSMVYRLLTDHAAQSQSRLQTELTQRGYRFQSYWVVNALAVEGDSQVAEWMARQPEVAAVGVNHQYDRPLPEPEEGDAINVGAMGWHIQGIGADVVWRDFGIEGAGITVAALDSGVLWNHTALQGNYRGYAGGEVNHVYNWMDTAGTPAYRTPIDPIGHGTHVMGTMVGRRGTDIIQSGVAPRATWIAVRGCGDYFCLEQDMLEAAQWLLAPTDLEGANPRPDLRPHIINNSWGFTGGGSEWFEGALAAWRAAGIFAPFAAGNGGPSCGTIDTPAISTNAFAIGATQQDSTIAPFSAHGPTYDGRVKPDLVAPGTGIYAPFGNGRFVSLSGTSMATPMVSGAVALLWSANPALIGEVATTEQILRNTATPLYTERCGSLLNNLPNNAFGMGLLNVEAAVREARVEIPWFQVSPQVVIAPGESVQLPVRFDAAQVPQIGTYYGRIAVATGATLNHTNVTMVVMDSDGMVETTGRLVDAESGAGVVGNLSFNGGASLQSNQNGEFSTQLIQGEYTLSATASGYLPLTVTATITDVTYLPLTITLDAPLLDVSLFQSPLQANLAWAEEVTQSVRLHNRGSQPLVITPTIPADEWQVVPLTFTTPYLLETFEVLRLENEDVYTRGVEMPFQVPLFGRYVTHLYPSSNGWIATAKTSDPRRTVRCLPTGFAYEGMLAPFWADLDPSQGGSIKAGLADPDTFVISYEGVPPRSTTLPIPATYTFQVVFRRDGKIEYRYGPMGAMPSRWAIGMSATQERAQSLGCFEEPLYLGYRGWEMLNQPSPRDWTVVDDESPITIAPGDSAFIPIGFRGYSPAPWLTAPMRARVQLQSNDLYHPTTDLHTAVTIGAAPHHVWLGFVGYKSVWKE